MSENNIKRSNDNFENKGFQNKFIHKNILKTKHIIYLKIINNEKNWHSST